jgi:hypothetical protein
MPSKKRKTSSGKSISKVPDHIDKIVAAEQQHIQYMSTLEYAKPFWQKLKRNNSVHVVDPFMTADDDVDPDPASFDGDMEMYCKKSEICTHISKDLNVEDAGIKHIVIPVGSLLPVDGSEIHWNCFVVEIIPSEPAMVTIIDPAKCSDGSAVYDYSDAILKHVSDCIKTIWGQNTVFRTLGLQMACQKDNFCGGTSQRDAFCQTWVVLLAEFVVKTTKRKNLESLKNFNFYINGKKLLKTWLRCRYGQLVDSNLNMTWLAFVEQSDGMSLFDYYDSFANRYVRAPASNVEDCMSTLLEYVKEDRDIKSIVGKPIRMADGQDFWVKKYDSNSQLYTIDPGNAEFNVQTVKNARRNYLDFHSTQVE